MNACGWPACRAIAPVALAAATAAAGLSAAGDEPVLGGAAQNPGSIFSRMLS